jgi:hypothetical protein
MLKNPLEYERDISLAKFTAFFFFQVSPDLLLVVSADIYQKALVDE